LLDHRNLGRSLRALWATLGVILLLGAGAAYGVTRYLQSELEADATKDARKLSADVLQPLTGRSCSRTGLSSSATGSRRCETTSTP
jgi:hypothetical protein